jgi:hypothetical protein
MADTETKSHEVKRTLKEDIIYPDHESRTTSELFLKSKERLKEDGHDECFICGSKENIETHHFGCEYSLANNCDFEKLKKLLLIFDIYGYSGLLKDIPIENVDDIRNMMNLCRHHHIETETGIHECSFPIFISQFIEKDGINMIPNDANQTINKI